ncbi:OPT/YSL family transporter [Haliangium sp.]|uniref:OPT/YSL family transporter n=1 Tax=Haliangium sp. TaxID=2663208 RepID=UPI003D0EC6B5
MQDRPSDPDAEAPGTHLPRQTALEWLLFGALAGLLAIANVYATLLTGFGFGGSIIAVVSAALVLTAIQGRLPSIVGLNLGQTMASAGASMGTAVAGYAAVLLVDPDFAPDLVTQIALFVTLGVVGVFVGTSVRRSMIRHFFPSGTACAVILKSLNKPTADTADPGRPLRRLGLGGLVAALASLPTKLAFERGGEALLAALPRSGRFQISLDPVLFGIGMIVGPRVGLGLVAGSLAVPWILSPALAPAGGEVDAMAVEEWKNWLAISLVALPTLAGIGFAYLLRPAPSLPPGLAPGRTEHPRPRRRTLAYAVVTGVALILGALCAHRVFDLPLYLALVVAALAWPLCIGNGRVAADTDINPLILLAIAVLALCAFALPDTGMEIALLGMVVIGTTIAGMAVDMMQDHRTGYLIDANPTHQTSVQIIGVVLAAVLAVPFLNLLHATMGIGTEGGLPAPGPRFYLIVAQTFAGAFPSEGALLWAVIAASGAGVVYTFLATWTRTAPWMPSLFGVAIGLLLPLPMSAAICVGSLITPAVSVGYRLSGKGTERGRRDAVFIGAGVLGGATVTGALLAIASALLQLAGLEWFFVV